MTTLTVLQRHRNLVFGIIVIGLLLAMAAAGAVWLPHDPNHTNVRDRFAEPSARHWFGTDQFGRDLFSRIAVGARTTLLVGAVAVTLGLSVGVLLGGSAGLFGGWRDEIAMRFVDAVSAFPPVLLAIVLATIMQPGPISGMLAIGIATVPMFARLTRAEFIALREAEFVRAAVALGASPVRILRHHLWRNTRSIIFVQATIAFAHAILAEAALSYLGLGTQPPHASWGRMLREAQDYVIFSSYPALFPGLAIGLTVLGLNMLGDGLRDALDPRTKR